MKILSLKLNNFRNYEHLELNFSPSKNIFIGKNGMGKTNIVEAIYVLAFTKSFRGSKEDVIIKYNEEFSKIEGIVEDNFKNNYQILFGKDEKKLKINNTNINRIIDYLSNICIVLFTSEDLKLIKDTPNTRRKLIDIELSQFSNDYLKILTLYNKVVKQRNSYLKTLYLNGMASKEYLYILTDQLIELGIKINKYRSDFVKKISDYLSINYEKITKNNNLLIKYKSSFEGKTKEELLNMYKKEEERDIVLGKTNIGIHHDDYEFILNGYNLKDYGSEGEQKNSIIALKLSEIDIFKNEINKTPILILDDLFSELDSNKINNILKNLDKDIQTFVTTTELNKAKKILTDDCKVFEVKNGLVSERMI